MNKKKIGVIGTGFISKGLASAVQKQDDFMISKVLTRRDIQSCYEFPRQDLLTNSVHELIENTDIVVECSGDVIHGTNVVDQAIKAGLPVITMNAELQITTGSYFAARGFITEAEGDQPGTLAALKEEVIQMGFKPIVYGNIKGFLNQNPTLEEMKYWSKKNGISLKMTTAATDGTKIQIEQALVANGLGASIAKQGLMGLSSDDISSGANILAKKAKEVGQPISDYILSPHSLNRVFICFEYDEKHKDIFKFWKLGDGPYYTLQKHYLLYYFEMMKTIKRVISGGEILLNNSSTPSISVAAIAKQPLKLGDKINEGIGSFLVRGEAVRITDAPNHLPIGLLQNAVVTKRIEADQQIGFDDVEIPETLALKAWLETKKKVLTR